MFSQRTHVINLNKHSVPLRNVAAKLHFEPSSALLGVDNYLSQDFHVKDKKSGCQVNDIAKSVKFYQDTPNYRICFIALLQIFFVTRK